MGTGTDYPYGAHKLTPHFSWVRVALGLFSVFCGPLFFLFSFSIDHCDYVPFRLTALNCTYGDLELIILKK